MGPNVRGVAPAFCAALVGAASGCDSPTQWSLAIDDASAAATPDAQTQPVDSTTNGPDAQVDAAWTPDGRHSGNPIIQTLFTADPTARVWDDGTTHWPKLHLTVNGTDYSFINTPPTGSSSTYTGHAFLTVPMTAGKTNTVTLANGDEDLNVDYITTTGF
jgi:hypothetical protein